MITLSPEEEYIVSMIRDMKPFEVITITADKDGKSHKFFIKRSYQVMVDELRIEAVHCKVDA